MKGHICPKCGTELHYEILVCGIRAKRIDQNGEYYFNAYCPTCGKYFKMTK